MAKDRTTIGQMREQVYIMTVASAPFGDYSIQNTYTQKYVLRARVRDLEGYNIRRDIGRTDGERTHVVFVRNGSTLEIDTSDLIRWRGDYYRITSIVPTGRTVDDPRNRFLRIEIVFHAKAGAFATSPLTDPLADVVYAPLEEVMHMQF